MGGFFACTTNVWIGCICNFCVCTSWLQPSGNPNLLLHLGGDGHLMLHVWYQQRTASLQAPHAPCLVPATNGVLTGTSCSMSGASNKQRPYRHLVLHVWCQQRTASLQARHAPCLVPATNGVLTGTSCSMSGASNKRRPYSWRLSWRGEQVCLSKRLCHTQPCPRGVALVHARAGVKSVLRVLAGSEQDAMAPTVHWLEFAVAQLVHVRPNLQVRRPLRRVLRSA